MYKDLHGFLELLKAKNDLLEIEEKFSPIHEISGIMKALDKKDGRALFFKRVNGYKMPLIGNLLGRRRRLAQALGVKEEKISEEYLLRRANPIKPIIVADGPVKELTIKDNLDLRKIMPILTHFDKDSGPYLTSAVTIAKDPETGVRGMGIHRVQIRGKKEIGIFLATPPLSTFLQKANKMNRPLEIAIVVGLDPITFFSSVIWAPEGIDKFDIAGGLAKKPIALVKCESVDLEVPAFGEFVLEGHLKPKTLAQEGPLGESSGYYFTFESPIGEIELVTHRRNPIYHALMPFTTEESVLVDLSWELDRLRSFQTLFPQVLNVHLKVLGSVVVVQIEKKSADDPGQIIDHILNSIPFTKIVIVVDSDIDIYDDGDVEWAVATRSQPDKDFIIKSDLPGFMLDPSSRGGEMTPGVPILVTKTSKLGINATKPLGEHKRFEKVDVPLNVRKRITTFLKKLNY